MDHAENETDTTRALDANYCTQTIAALAAECDAIPFYNRELLHRRKLLPNYCVYGKKTQSSPQVVLEYTQNLLFGDREDMELLLLTMGGLYVPTRPAGVA
eukprot:2263314-Amphidinium_carterae.1